ncbi:MAG: TIGR01777 family protein [Proteobacteria bacterium]|nr:TIGR01777 family protein [Pseudomonadota bacterium]
MITNSSDSRKSSTGERGVFTQRSHLDAPAKDVFSWHSRPGAIQRLSPPWDPLQVLHSTGGIDPGAEVVMKMKAGPVSFKWFAKHTDFQENALFRDEQVEGPFSSWIHTHGFEADGENACFLSDTVEYRLPFHPLGNRFFGATVRKKLARIFAYRHATTARDISLHAGQKHRSPLTVLVSGAGGLIGSSLIPFFTTGGHRVIRLVRREPDPERDEVFWDPMAGVLDPADLEGVDAVVHLAGENIGQRWSEKKKGLIVESRNKGTSLIAETMSGLKSPPRVFVCASAIGYYGDRGNTLMTEESSPGRDFISDVCVQWEKSTEPATDRGIRTVFLRIGVVLNPLSGALARLLPPFRLGLGGKIASGSQYMSWVDLDDVIGSIHHLLFEQTLEGPVNVVAPNPVTNLDFTRILGRVLKRPAIMVVPETSIKLAFGEMGKEVLLSSTRVAPEKLLASGYRFHHSDLEKLLRHVLGKTK